LVRRSYDNDNGAVDDDDDNDDDDDPVAAAADDLRSPSIYDRNVAIILS
jgi:hypothetical protein